MGVKYYNFLILVYNQESSQPFTGPELWQPSGQDGKNVFVVCMEVCQLGDLGAWMFGALKLILVHAEGYIVTTVL